MPVAEPTLSLVVIRSLNIEKASGFYSSLGVQFTKHAHGKGPEHFSAIINDTVFEIYPIRNPHETTAATRLGFKVRSLKQTIEGLKKLGATILSEPAQTEFGFSAILQNFDGHKVELYEID